MVLAIDIGNTDMVFGLYLQDRWITHWRIQTNEGKSSDEYEVILRGLFQRDGIDTDQVSKTVVSSVVPSLVPRIKVLIQRLFRQKPLLIAPEIYTHLPIEILNPDQIGSDLVCNAMAAYHGYPGNRIIVDFGTALTFTTILESGEIAGVAIAPGLKTAVQSLTRRTALLPTVELNPPPSVLGKDTVQAIQSGVIFGYAGLIESLLARIELEIEAMATVIATGGLSGVMTPLIKGIHHLAPMLTLEGLRLIAETVDHPDQ